MRSLLASSKRELESVLITREQISQDLKEMGLDKGDTVAVALSLKSIGFVEGGPNTFIDAVLDVIGSDGTIMMNTFTSFFPLGGVDPQYVFDNTSSIPYTGKVPIALMHRKNSIRSRHPTCSVASLGRHAGYLTREHDEKASPYLPYSKIAEIGGKYLAIGIENNLVAIRHEAQRIAGVSMAPILVAVQYSNKNGKTGLFIGEHPPCEKNLHKLVPELDKRGILTRGKIGEATAILAQAKELLEDMTNMLKEDPSLNLCDDILCYRCRELERRMNLYNRIKDPRFFQRSRLVMKTLALRNRLIIRNYTHLAFKKKKSEKKEASKKCLP